MHNVRFLPDDVTVEVPTGTLISEAAIKAGIERIHLPCGGKGTCRRCLVEVVEGHPLAVSSAKLDQAMAGRGLVLSCQTKINEDMVIRAAGTHDAAMRVVGDSHLLISEELLPDPNALSTLYSSERLVVPMATIDEHYSDWQRLVREINRKTSNLSVNADIWVLRSLADTLREQNGEVTVILQEENSSIRVLDVQPGHVRICAYGLAIDVGTTTVAVQLVDMVDGKILASATGYNAQVRRGSDVISRIDYIRTAPRRLELRSLILESINGLIEDVCSQAGLSCEEIRSAFIAGNTTMMHLLLALPPKYIREYPYVPTVNAIPTQLASEVGINISQQALVDFAPGVGSYVGGDISAGLLCTDIPFKNEDIYLFLDIGTNGEIVLGNSDWMVTCACSAGPAFEGSGIKCGMRATTGAIEYIEISDDSYYVTYDVIGGGKPKGICGSGLICALGEMLQQGIVDQSGHLNMELDTPRLVRIDNQNVFVVDWDLNRVPDLVITESDIENLMRTKAAIYAACVLILSNVGLEWSMVSKVYIAGGFGRYLQVEDAILIGLLPDLSYDKFTYIGNSALTGSYIALLSRESRAMLQDVTAKMTYIDLSSESGYMDSYLGAMFLPHTEMSQFPSVAAKLDLLKTRTIGGK